MFEIGTSLREARVRQGVDLLEAERSTKIRSKYLRALEDERFELLPAQTYVKGFLRSYADFLGLDGQLYVDEYNSRYVGGEEEAPLRARRGRQSPAHRRVESSVLLVALAGIAAVTALVFVAWKWGGADPATIPTNLPITRPSETGAAAPVVPPRQRWISVELTAQRGDSRVAVYRNAASGKLLYEGTLERGQSRPFAGRRLWLLISAPGNLVARVNGRRVQLPGRGTEPVVAVASAAGIAPAAG